MKATEGKGIKTLTPKQMRRRLPIALAQVKTVNTFETLLTKLGKWKYNEINKGIIQKWIINSGNGKIFDSHHSILQIKQI